MLQNTVKRFMETFKPTSTHAAMNKHTCMDTNREREREKDRETETETEINRDREDR